MINAFQSLLLISQDAIDLFSDEVKLTPSQIKAAKIWKDLLDNDQLEVETQHETEFTVLILNKILGYEEIWAKGSNLKEKKKFMDKSYAPANGKPGIVFELKGTEKDRLHTTTKTSKTWPNDSDKDLEEMMYSYKQEMFNLVQLKDSLLMFCDDLVTEKDSEFKENYLLIKKTYLEE